MEVQRNTLRVTIKSSTGIGQATLSHLSGKGIWPETVLLLISDRDGFALKELEGFSIRCQALIIEGSQRMNGQMDVFELNPGGTSLQGKTPSRVNVQVTLSEEFMQIVVPGERLMDESTLDIQWVDFYRQ